MIQNPMFWLQKKNRTELSDLDLSILAYYSLNPLELSSNFTKSNDYRWYNPSEFSRKLPPKQKFIGDYR